MDKTLSKEEIDIMQVLTASRLHLVKACKATPSGSSHVLVRANEVKKLLDNLTAAELALRAVPRWIPVAETLPEVGWNTYLSNPVYVFGLGRTPCIRHYEPEAESWYDAAHGQDEPRSWYSHWMHLPAAPSQEKGAQDA